MNREKFKVENFYQKYLSMISLDESKMREVQKYQLRHTFYAAWGMLLVTLKKDISKLNEQEALDVLDSMFDQISEFLNKPPNK